MRGLWSPGARRRRKASRNWENKRKAKKKLKQPREERTKMEKGEGGLGDARLSVLLYRKFPHYFTTPSAIGSSRGKSKKEARRNE